MRTFTDKTLWQVTALMMGYVPIYDVVEEGVNWVRTYKQGWLIFYMPDGSDYGAGWNPNKKIGVIADSSIEWFAFCHKENWTADWEYND